MQNSSHTVIKTVFWAPGLALLTDQPFQTKDMELFLEFVGCGEELLYNSLKTTVFLRGLQEKAPGDIPLNQPIACILEISRDETQREADVFSSHLADLLFGCCFWRAAVPCAEDSGKKAAILKRPLVAEVREQRESGGL